MGTPNINLNNDRGWKMHVPDLYERLGLGRKGKLPWEGMSGRMIQNVWVFVISVPDARAYRLFHRVRCACPLCGQEMSAGRLHQHMPIHDKEQS